MAGSRARTYSENRLVFNLFRFFLITGAISTLSEIYYSFKVGRPILVSIIMTIFFVTILFLINRYRKLMLPAMLVIFSATLIGVTVVFITQGGMLGMAPFLLIANLAIHTILFSGKLRITIMLIFMVMTIFLMYFTGIANITITGQDLVTNLNESFIPYMLFMMGVLIYMKTMLSKAIRLNEQGKEELSRINSELQKRSDKLFSGQAELKALNENLEDMVSTQTDEIKTRNDELAEYAYVNAHLLRAPLTRVMGLTYLLNSQNYLSKNKLERLKEKAEETDAIVKRINKILT